MNNLLPRERNVIDALLAGHTTDKQIAQALCLQISTVRTYVSGILSKTYSANRTDLVLWALRNGWTLPPLDGAQ